MVAGISPGQRVKLGGKWYVKQGRMWRPYAIIKGTVDEYKGKTLPGAPEGMKHSMAKKGYLTEEIII